MMKNEVFLDTAYALAITVASDAFHIRAAELSKWLQTSNTVVVTTHAVLLEVGNALSKIRYRQEAARYLQALAVDPVVIIEPVTTQLYNRALDLYANRPDKEWGLVDCISIVVMQDQGIYAALTTDDHFRQAGFRVLMREDPPWG